MKLNRMIYAARVLMVAALLFANSPLPALAASANAEEPPPPAFDDFSTPIIISSLPYTTSQSVQFATVAGDDPLIPNSCWGFPDNQGYRTVWFKYIPAQNAQLTVDTHGSDYDTVLMVWTGTRGSLVNRACNDDDDFPYSPTSLVSLAVTAGTTYYIEVASYNSETGNSLTLHASVPANPPGAFNKSSPANAATGVSASPTLSWGTSANATSYEYCLDFSNDNNCASAWTSTGSNTSVALSGLATSSTYYWQVRARNTDGTTEANGGTWWSFSTVGSGNNDDFITPLVISSFPYTHTQGVGAYTTASNDPVLTCMDFTDARYKTAWYSYTAGSSGTLTLDTSASTYDTLLAVWTGSLGSLVSVGCNDDVDLVDTWSYLALSVSAGTTYYIEVASVADTPSISLTLNADRVLIPPGAFGKTSPANAATGISFTPTLSWAASSGVTSYEYCYDTTNDAACAAWTSSGASTSAGLSGLSPSTTYYWQVRAVNGDGTTYADGSAAAYWSFTTSASGNNDEFISPVVIGSLAFTNTQSVSGYTSAVDDPNLPCSSNQKRYLTAWYRYTPGQNRQLTVDTYTSNYDTVLAIWTGTQGSLVNIGCNDNSGGSQSSLTVSVTAGTTYFIEIASVTAAPSTPSLTIHASTVANPPGAFSKSSPANAATGIATAPTLSWGASANALSYDYCIDTTNDNACTGWTSTGSSTSVGLSGLATSSSYYWHVRAVNEDGLTYANGSTTAFWSFSTAPSGNNDDFITPVSINSLPYTNSQSISGYTTASDDPLYTCPVAQPFFFTAWYRYTPGQNRQLILDTFSSTYDTVLAVYTGSQGSLTSLACNDNYGGNQSRVELAVTAGTTYYIEVASYEEIPAGTTLVVHAATISAPPGAFSRISPANGATNQATDPTLTWGTSSGATSYEYCYDTTNDNACTGWASNGTSTSKALSGLSLLTTYYWHVRAVNEDGSTYAGGSATSFWSFTTLPPAPGAFNKATPSNAAVNVSLAPTLTWGSSSGATSYEYCYDTSGNNACDGSWVPAGLSTSAALGSLALNTTYYWQVRAINTSGTTYADTATWWSFTTLPPAPGAFNKTDPFNGAINVSLSPSPHLGNQHRRRILRLLLRH